VQTKDFQACKKSLVQTANYAAGGSPDNRTHLLLLFFIIQLLKQLKSKVKKLLKNKWWRKKKEQKHEILKETCHSSSLNDKNANEDDEAGDVCSSL